jgi:hypothetical protein
VLLLTASSPITPINIPGGVTQRVNTLARWRELPIAAQRLRARSATWVPTHYMKSSRFAVASARSGDQEYAHLDIASLRAKDGRVEGLQTDVWLRVERLFARTVKG